MEYFLFVCPPALLYNNNLVFDSGLELVFLTSVTIAGIPFNDTHLLTESLAEEQKLCLS